MSEIKRILIITNTMDVGGAETFLMKVYRAIDRNKFQFDFLINKFDNCYYKKEINNLGGNVFHGVSKSENCIKCFYKIFSIVKNNSYDSVFFVAVHPLVVLDLLAALLGGARIRLVRSTNSKAGGFFSKLLAHVFRPFVRIVSTHMIAPSVEAARWLFGYKVVKSKNFTLVKNGLDLKQYKFDEVRRNKIRNEFKLHDAHIYGHIGRFTKQKNHEFIINVFYEIAKIDKDAVLFLVGNGEELQKIKLLVDKLKINSKVFFLGIRSDIPDLLMAMDMLIFPSLYEGLPNVVIEAQATGLQCVLSDTITREVKVSSVVTFLSLEDGACIWASKINALFNTKILSHLRTSKFKELEENGYGIMSTVVQFGKLF